MGCCDGCIKYLLFFFNLIFSLSGLAIIIVGGILLSQVSDFGNILSDISSGLTAPQITLIVVGVIIFVVATLGCCGAIRESRCMLISFAVLLLTIFVIELAIGIYAVTNFDNLKTDIEKGLGKNFDKYSSDSDVREAYDALQKTVECCGIQGMGDYQNRGLLIPDSCCINYSSGCAGQTPGSQNPNLFYRTGCVDKLTDFTSDAGKILGGVAIALSLIELVGVIFALRLASQVKD